MEATTLTFPHLQEVLGEYGARAKNLYREKLAAEGKNASGDLSKKVTFEVRHKGNTYRVGLNLLYYWRFVEGGTKGKKYPTALCRQHFPPVSAIRKWIEVKPVIPRPDKHGRIPRPASLAYLIARKIARDGIKPAPVLKETSAQTWAEFEKRLHAAFLEDIKGMTTPTLSIFRGV